MRGNPSGAEVSRAFERLIRMLARDIERRASAHGLPSCEWFVLAELEHRRAISLRALALASAVSIPAASKAVHRLVADGLATMDRVSGNKRMSAISITGAGMRHLMKARARKDLSETYYEVMTAEDLDALSRSLGALVSNLAKTGGRNATQHRILARADHDRLPALAADRDGRVTGG